MKTLEELNAVREKMYNEIAVRTRGANNSKYEKHVLVCGGTGCTSSGSAQVISVLEDELKKNGIEDKVSGRKNRLLRTLRSRSDYDSLS